MHPASSSLSASSLEVREVTHVHPLNLPLRPVLVIADPNWATYDGHRWGDRLESMPRVKRRESRRHRERQHEQQVPAFIRMGPRERSVLVVESDPEVQVQMARALRRDGHRVVGTSSGDGALALVAQWDVDLVLISEDLPGRAGIEVTRLVSAAQPQAPIIVMSHNAEPSLRAAARSAGAVDCLAKPLRIEQLARWLSPSPFDGIATQQDDHVSHRQHEAVAE